jgi:hypothetical protein
MDTISDNAANAALVVGGRPFRPLDVDLRWVGALLFRNGQIEETGIAAGVLNHPRAASHGSPIASRRTTNISRQAKWCSPDPSPARSTSAKRRYVTCRLRAVSARCPASSLETQVIRRLAMTRRKQHPYRRVQARKSDSERLPHQQSADVRRHSRPRSQDTGEMPERISKDQCANMFAPYEDDRGGWRRQHRRHHQDDGVAARTAVNRAPVNTEWLKMFPDEHSRPGAPCALQCRWTAARWCNAISLQWSIERNDRLTPRHQDDPRMPSYLAIRSKPAHVHHGCRRRKASTVSSMCSGRSNKYPVRPGRGLSRCRRRHGKLHFGYTRRLASSAASSCRRRHMAPIIRWFSMRSRRWGRTTSGCANALVFAEARRCVSRQAE